MTTVMGYRQTMVECCTCAVKNRTEITYAEVRPIPVNLPKFHLPFTTDCSGFVTMMAKWSGNPDPNGNDFDGQGYTGTMMSHLPHIALHQTLRGDLVVFGAYPGLHVVALLDGGNHDSNPPVASHGGPGDPNRFLLSDLMSFFGQNCVVTYLSLRPNDA